MKSFVLSFPPFFRFSNEKPSGFVFRKAGKKDGRAIFMHCLYFTTHLCLFASVFPCVYFIQSDEMPVFCFSHTDISHVFSLARLTQSHTDSPATILTLFPHIFLSQKSHICFPTFFLTQDSLFFSHTVLSHIFSHFGFSLETFLIFFFAVFLTHGSHRFLSFVFSRLSLFVLLTHV